jgi:hypothetical protein
MVVLGAETHHMGKYQPIPLVCCEELEERVSKYDPSQGPEGLGLTLIHSRSIKKGAIHKLFGTVRV